MCCWGEHRLRYSWLCSPRRPAVKRSGKSLPKSLKMRLHCIRWPGAIQFSGQPLAKKSTVTFRVFTWEVTSLNRQVLSFSSSHCHAGDRWKEIPGTPQRSKADSQSLWTRSWKAHQNPKSCPGQGSEGVPEQAEMLSLGCPLLCSEPDLAAFAGRRCGSAREVLREWELPPPCSSHASLNLGASILCVAPHPEQRKRLPLSYSPLL